MAFGEATGKQWPGCSWNLARKFLEACKKGMSTFQLPAELTLLCIFSFGKAAGVTGKLSTVCGQKHCSVSEVRVHTDEEED